MNLRIPLGRVIADVAGTSLTAAERELLTHPQVGGVILFSRNFESVSQLGALTAEIHELRAPQLLIAVDHEGGRVQRFREGFTRIPPMRTLGQLWDADEENALTVARSCGMVLAAELRACDIDLSFAPVLDLDHGPSGVIGDRAFHRDPEVVAALAAALMRGMRDAGMAACAKHFPGHGYVAADSHLDTPLDQRTMVDIEQDDLVPFRKLIAAGLGAVMPAHVVYSAVDPTPAGFSGIWLGYLRSRLGFDGIIFSDDLSMDGAKAFGGVVERGSAAIAAGCDMVLLCNEGKALRELVDGFARADVSPVMPERAAALFKPALATSRAELAAHAGYLQALALVRSMD